jgi:FlaA1/EpsC-like NDP-sugar epimerase
MREARVNDYNLDGKTILITGGTGSWGQEFTRQFLSGTKVQEIRIYSRGEYHQVEMRRAFYNERRLKFVIGDVRDTDRLDSAMRRVDVVIHLAALKHVPVVEEHLWEALRTNTIGTQNVVEAAQDSGVERVLFVSSDKAVDPLNFYGISKLAAERLVIAANQEGSDSRFIVYRAGNVMGSAGSVVPVFQQQLVHLNKVTLTDPKMTRFFTSKREVVQLAIRALRQGIGGETFIPKMKAATLELLAQIMVENLGNGEAQVERIDVRPGEKWAELLFSRNETERARELRDMWVILPLFPAPLLQQHYAQAKRVAFSEYSSDAAPQFSRDELEALLRTEGFLSRNVPPLAAPLHFRKGESVFH